MKSKHGEIQRKDIEWLYSAIDEYGKQIIYIFDNSGIATDGVRLHVINPDGLPEDIEQLPMNTYDFFSKNINLESCLAKFCINPELLIKALSIFGGRTKIELLGDVNNFHGIKISSEHSDNIAFIACMEGEGTV